MNSTPDAPAVDPRLLAAEPLARAALYEVTPETTVGTVVGHTVEDDGVVSLRFSNTMEGYPGWFWTVSLAVVEDAEPTVLEVELLPGEHALLAPEWVPWAVRLAEYHAAQAAAEENSTESESDEEDSDDESEGDEDADDLDDLDAADFDEDGSPLLHSGDVDGVDIDELDADYDGADEGDEDFDEDEESEGDEDSDESEGDEATDNEDSDDEDFDDAHA